MQLENKVAFITGGGSGLGLATAKTFIAEGAKVMIFDFNPKSQEVADEIGAKFVQGDVSKAESVEAAVAKTVEEFGRRHCRSLRGCRRRGRRRHLDRRKLGAHQRHRLLGRVLHQQVRHRAAPQAGRGRRRCQPRFDVRPRGRLEQHRLLSLEGRRREHDPRRRDDVRKGRHPRERGGPRRHPHAAHRRADPRAVRKPAPGRRVGEAQEVADLITFLASDKAKFITEQPFRSTVDIGRVARNPQHPSAAPPRPRGRASVCPERGAACPNPGQQCRP